MIMDKFKEVALNVHNSYIKQFQKNGGKVIGVCYSQVPVFELYHSLGILGVRIRANEVKTTTIGDTYFGPVICSFPKGILQMAGEGRYNFLDGLITSTVCDSMRRVDDCWRKAATDIEGILPDYHYLFGVPHKAEDFSIEWLTDELNKHIGQIEAHFKVSFSLDKLKESIKLYNEARTLLRKFDEIRGRKKAPISGSDALMVFVAASSMPIEEFIGLMKELLSELEQSDISLPGKRLFLVGSANDDPGFVESIEEVGAVVVGDLLSFGSKYYDNMIDEDASDLIEALAKGYLLNLRHPRIFGEFEERLEFIKQRIAACKADGVLLQNIRFCDLHGCENSVYAENLEEVGIPCIKLEREYGPLVEVGRVKMRVQAFIERISN